MGRQFSAALLDALDEVSRVADRMETEGVFGVLRDPTAWAVSRLVNLSGDVITEAILEKAVISDILLADGIFGRKSARGFTRDDLCRHITHNQQAVDMVDVVISQSSVIRVIDGRLHVRQSYIASALA